MSKNKTITVHISKEQYIKTYLTLWNGMINLTGREMDIAVALVSKYLDLIKVVSDMDLVYDILFSTQTTRDIRTKLSMTDSTFNNYKASLKEKGVLHVDKDGNYTLDERVLPVEEITFKFIIK